MPALLSSCFFSHPKSMHFYRVYYDYHRQSVAGVFTSPLRLLHRLATLCRPTHRPGCPLRAAIALLGHRWSAFFALRATGASHPLRHPSRVSRVFAFLSYCFFSHPKSLHFYGTYYKIGASWGACLLQSPAPLSRLAMRGGGV